MLPYTTHMTHEEQKKELTPVQKKFAREYALDFNGAAAYMRASGTTNKRSAGVQACKLLKMPKVQEEYKMFVKEQLGPLEKHLIGNVQFWIDIRDDKEASTTVRLKASEHLAKWEQMFVEKKEIDVTAAVTIVDDIK